MSYEPTREEMEAAFKETSGKIGEMSETLGDVYDKMTEWEGRVRPESKESYEVVVQRLAHLSFIMENVSVQIVELKHKFQDNPDVGDLALKAFSIAVDGDYEEEIRNIEGLDMVDAAE